MYYEWHSATIDVGQLGMTVLANTDRRDQRWLRRKALSLCGRCLLRLRQKLRLRLRLGRGVLALHGCRGNLRGLL